MKQRRKWKANLVLFEQESCKPVERILGPGFHVGIWWHDAELIVAFLQPVSENDNQKHWIDSDLSHDSAWDIARKLLAWPSETEYFQVPRGRVVWDFNLRSGIFYHGNATPVDVFEKLAELFQLPRWEARLDEHYLTGDALEEFYGLE